MNKSSKVKKNKLQLQNKFKKVKQSKNKNSLPNTKNWLKKICQKCPVLMILLMI